MMRAICQFKILTIIVLSFFVLSSKGQVYQSMPQYGYTGPRFNMDSTLSIPTTCGVPTLKSNLTKKAAIAFDSCNGVFYQYNPKTLAWSQISGGGGGTSTFTNNIIMNGTTSNRLGNYVNGDTIPVSGLSLDSAFKVIAQRAVAPTYVQPTTTISSSPSATNYEIGTTLNLTFSSTFTQNDAGALTSTLYIRNPSTTLGGNTDTYVLNGPISYKVTKTYNQGACKMNNLGVLDCTGRINAGSITSSNLIFSPLPKRYWGQSSTSNPSNSTILASLNGGNELSTIKDKYGFSIGVTGTNQYIFYAYPSSYGALTSIIISGLESIGAFNSSIVNVTNAQGYVQSYYVYVSQNQFNNTNISFNSVN